jgi:hypothetical protein
MMGINIVSTYHMIEEVWQGPFAATAIIGFYDFFTTSPTSIHRHANQVTVSPGSTRLDIDQGLRLLLTVNNFTVRE